MEALIKSGTLVGTSRQLLPARRRAPYANGLWLLLLAAIMVLSACGRGGGSSSAPPIDLSLSGNWQFTMAPPADGSFTGGLQGGFLLENGGSVNGAATYAVSLPDLLVPCNTGSATVTGTISAETVNLTAVAGTQTFTLAGMLNLNGTTMTGTYSSTAGAASDGSPCGTAQTGLQWSAYVVPPLTGSIQGVFHSAGGTAGLSEQDFLVSGGIIQAANSGTSSEAVTGNLSFFNSLTQASDYPCFTVAEVYGQISGNSVSLQIVGSDGTEWGLIGEPVGSLGSTGVNPVTFDPVNGTYLLHGTGPSYSVATAACAGTLENVDTAGDFGNICLALNSTTACQQPIALAPSALMFDPQAVGSAQSIQTITLTNHLGNTLGNVTLTLVNNSGANNFMETDICGLGGLPSQGLPFNLNPGQTCDISIMFSPLETCAVGTPPNQCPSPLIATLVATSPSDETIVTVPITGTGFSQQALSTSRLDFGVEGMLDARLSLLKTFTGHNKHSVEIVVAGPRRSHFARCGGSC